MVPATLYRFTIDFEGDVQINNWQRGSKRGKSEPFNMETSRSQDSVSIIFELSLIESDDIFIAVTPAKIQWNRSFSRLTIYCTTDDDFSCQEQLIPNTSDFFTLLLSDFDPFPLAFSVIVQDASLPGPITVNSIDPQFFRSKYISTLEEDRSKVIYAAQPSVTELPDDESTWVWYATNRQDLRDAQGQLQGFAKAAAPTTTYGKCLVHIPKSHAIGQTKSGFWRRMLLTCTFRQDDQALRLVGTLAHDATPHWTEIRTAAAQWSVDERCALVFIHGYNVSFEDAAIRAAQIGYDLQVSGPVSFFSWPSQGTLLGYAADEAAIEASEAAITQYLLDFAQHSRVKRVHVIAHSMGNRGLLRALQRIVSNAATGERKLFDHFILAAPDVDKTLFLSLADYYTRVARHTTLYISDKDLALASSRMLRIGQARAGLAPPVTIAPNIDTVHVANVDVTLLGHGYVAESRDVLTDMHQLIYQNAPPNKRMALRPVEEDGQRYWVIGA